MSRTTSTGKRVAAALLGSVLLVSACASGSGEPTPSRVRASATPASGDSAALRWSEVVDPKSIPLGDGKLVTAPTAGSLYACRTTFDGQGAHADGPWIDEAAKTWDATTKIQVTGGNTWPQARYGETVEGGARVLRTNDLPTEQVTGDFPIAADDPAYQYDRNPNGIAAKTVEVRLPLNPSSSPPSCVDQGPIGVLKNGVLLFNALDATGRDAVAHETQDVCDGHPERSSSYHYHGVPSCLLAAVPRPGSTLVGYALDGYGIYVERDAAGNLPGNADLDECHGRTSTVTWNGEERSVYHYSATLEYPFAVGCYRGTPVRTPH